MREPYNQGIKIHLPLGNRHDDVIDPLVCGKG